MVDRAGPARQCSPQPAAHSPQAGPPPAFHTAHELRMVTFHFLKHLKKYLKNNTLWHTQKSYKIHISVSTNKSLFMDTFMCVLSTAAFTTMATLSTGQGPHGSHRRKYLLPGPLQRKFASRSCRESRKSLHIQQRQHHRSVWKGGKTGGKKL